MGAIRLRDWPAIFKDAAERGLGVRELAREQGVNNTRIYQTEKAYGIKLPRRVESSPVTIVPPYVPDGTEQWRPIPGFERYEASSHGRIRSLISNKMINQPFNASTGYHGATLWAENDGKKSRWVHRWIAMAFVSNPDGLPQVNHIDHVRTNNVPENLEWTTREANYKHSHERSMSHSNPKVRRVLSPDDVAEIMRQKPARKQLGNGPICEALAAKYGVNEDYIRKIWTGERRQYDGGGSRAMGTEE